MGKTIEKALKKSSVNSLEELALLFLKLGITAFGGPAVHIAMMQEEVVNKKKWLTQEKFLDLVGVTNLIPGPNSTEMAIHIGLLRAGVPGLIVAGTCFIIPAAIIVLLLAWAYVSFGKLPQISGILYTIKPVVIAVVLQALWGFGKTAIKTKFLGLICVIAIILSVFRLNELVILFGAGIILALIKWFNTFRKTQDTSLFSSFFLMLPFLEAIAVTPTVTLGIWPIFIFFLKVGSVLFGSGYVLIAFLRADLVEKYGWLTETQLLDAIAIGQVTPGPLFTTATFIGYLLAGYSGALAATVGIFLPAFIFVLASNPLIPRLRKSPIMGAFLDGVNVTSLALMATALWQLTSTAIVDYLTLILALLSAIALIWFRINSTWLIAASVIIGLILKFI
ncbi:MAG: chromate efflux transporter [Acidobacteria bacterium]|nr:chromate efflux transporter [Acidobacteriota bacterium]